MPHRDKSARKDLHATTIAAESESPSRRSEPDVDVLVIAWYPHEPSRIGELAVVPSNDSTYVLGRGGDDDEPRLRFFRPRPGGRLDPAGPLASPALSRRQLEVRATTEGLEVLRVGKCPMRLNGVECEKGTLRPGDTLRLRQELLLLYLRRPARLSALRHFDIAQAGEFGEADQVGMIGDSPAAWALRESIGFAARTDAHVLCVGESGTGKELAARAIHRLSRRSGRPLVARNAATLPSGLIDAELFGNVRNYPNPGMADRPGLLGQADGGFLFLDEIGELPSELQAHLLRVLDAGGEYQRLGESTSRRSNFRLIAATNRDPSELKHDLRARLTVRVEVPPLSERREDIPLLVRHLVARAAEKSPEVAARFVDRSGNDQPIVRVDAKLVDALLRRDFEGNTRELEAVLWAAMAASHEDSVSWTEGVTRPESARPSSRDSAGRTSRPPRNQEPSESEIRAALAREDGNVARAARALGLSSRYALYRMMTKLGIEAGADS